MRCVIFEHRTSSRGRRLLLCSALAAAATVVSAL
ncbi:adenosine deaminase, partial [Streptomyces sp. DpondAA-F4]